MRKGFSFVEVLVSVTILALMGTALIKFNSFNKRTMENNILKQEALLLSNAMAYEKVIDNNKEIELYEIFNFPKIDDKDREFLKSIKLKATREIEDKLFLGNDGKDDRYLEYGKINLIYNEITQNYLWVQKENDDQK